MLQNKFPNVRFSKYLDIWKTTKLNMIAEIIGGGTPDTKQSSYWNGGINWFSPTEVGKTVYLTKSEKTISQLGLQKSSAKLLPAFKTILFTSRAGIGDVGILTEESATNQGFQSLVVNEGTDVYFLYSYSNKIKKYALKHSAGSTFLEISGKELGKMDLSIPSLQEQSAIGSLFRTLDDLLSSYKDNLANYQSLKATMLSKMFPKAGQTVPDIRLEGFEGEWEIKKFKSISNKRGKSNSKGYDYPAYFVSNQSGLIPQSEQFEGSRLENLEKTSYKIVEPNEFAYNPARINVGSIAFNDLNETVIVSSLYVIFSLDKSINHNYALLFIKSPEFNKEVRRNTEGSVREYLFYENFANIRIPIPSTFEEQQAIGSYFSNLDNLIAAHQEKISQLETLKKKLLQDMFI